MKFYRTIYLFIIWICFSTNSTAQYIQVDDTFTAQQLVENVLINSPCANVSNFTVSGGNFGNSQNSYGYFNSNSSGFPFLEGVVLSTGKAISTQGPNANILSENAPGWLGDYDLEQALNVSNTSNATILEFDFIPLTSKISFDYIFSSEEYQGSAPCTYSDGFAFLLKIANSTSPYQNLALVPNTNTPVKVTTVHADIPGSCPAQNEAYFGSYNSVNSPTNFNGQTIIMTAKTTVIPGTKYHIKLVIADETNPLYDSAIFLGGGSFNVGTDLGEDQLIATQNPVCEGETYTLDAFEVGANTYKWYKNNIEIVGENNPTYTVTSAGIYSVDVALGSSACIASGEITIEYSPLPSLTNTTIVQCDDDNDGITLFNLSKADTIIKNNDSSLGVVTYYENLIDAQNQNLAQAISIPENYQSIAKTVYASVTNNFGCANVAMVVLQISNNSVSQQTDLETCDTDGVKDGFFEFDLSDGSEADTKVLVGLPSGLVVEYYPTYNDALLQNNLLSDNYTNTIQYQMDIYAKIINGSDCYGIIPLRLIVNSNLPNDFDDEEVTLCNGNTLTLSVANTFATYYWSNGDTDSSTDINSPGIYTLTVTDANTCEATKKFIATEATAPSITTVEIKDFQNNNNTVLINYTGIGNYQFSIDGIHFQDSPFFTNVQSGVYNVWVKNFCGLDTKKIYVLDCPNFFTPNNDGFNDVWTVQNLINFPSAEITIFDRYGILIKQINSTGLGWDGTFNGKSLPASDYWYRVKFEDGRNVQGHFTLKR
jgi:gliding motility-associated-like protein